MGGRVDVDAGSSGDLWGGGGGGEEEVGFGADFYIDRRFREEQVAGAGGSEADAEAGRALNCFGGYGVGAAVARGVADDGAQFCVVYVGGVFAADVVGAVGGVVQSVDDADLIGADLQV